MAITSAASATLGIKLSVAQVVENPSTRNATPAPVVLLTRGLAAGDEEAFREFHKLYFDRLYRFLLAVTRGQEQQAQDAFQETLLRVVRHARPFDDEDVFWCWLKAVGRSAAHDLGRKNRRYFSLLQHFAFRSQKSEANQEAPEDRLGELLQESLVEMGANDRRLVESKYLDGRTVKELSALVGATEKAVESRLLRLRRELRGRILQKLKEP